MQVTAENTSSIAQRAASSDAQETRQPALQRSLRITHFVSSLKVGGMEHFVLRIAAHQSTRHEISIVALHDGPLRAEAQRLGLKVYVLGGKQKHLRALRGALLFARLRPHIAHAHNQTSLHYAVLAKRVGQAKVVMTNHGQGLASPRTPTAQEWSQADRVIAVSQAVAERLKNDELSGKVSVILNGIEIREPQYSRQHMRGELDLEGRLAGLIVARIDGLKGHDTLIKSLARLKERGLPITILVAGDGAERQNLQDLAHSLGLGQEDIRFLGFRSDVPDLHAASDFFVLPSVTEGLPLSVLEAMSAGKPVIATPVGGIPELVDSGRHGLLVPVGDDTALAEAIAQIAKDETLRRALGQAGRERVESDFSFARMTARYESLYAQLAGVSTANDL